LDLAKYNAYLTFCINNDKSVNDTIIFYAGSTLKHIEIFSLESNQHKLVSYTINKPFNGFIPLIISPNTTKQFFAKLIFSRKTGNVIEPHLIAKEYEKDFQKSYYNFRSDIKTFGLVLSGILLMMILFTITNYFLSRKKEFLYYSLYNICIFFIVFFNATLYKHSSTFSALFWEYIDFALLLAGCIFYIEFTRKFLNTPVKYKLVDKVFKIEEIFVGITLLLFTSIHFFTNNINVEVLLEDLMKIIILAFGIFYIIMALTQKQKLIMYLAVGNGLSLIFWIISLLLILGGVVQTNIFTSAFVYYEVGLVMALIAFLLGLTYKNRQEIIENTKEQEALKLEAAKQKYETEIAVYKAQQEERNRISADMHDDLGAGMTSIRLYSELAKNKLADKDLPELNKISSSANELLSKMNAIIWSMASSNDTLENMVAYLRGYAIEYFEDTGIKCNINLPAELTHATVNGFIRRNVFLVVKEALNNILKHANATEVTLTLIINGKIVQLFIHDNGKGIDFDNLRQFSNGLKNMKKRMEDVEFDFTIENKNGTLITLTREIKD
jgi:signal transduction histidine kinase